MAAGISGPNPFVPSDVHRKFAFTFHTLSPVVLLQQSLSHMRMTNLKAAQQGSRNKDLKRHRGSPQSKTILATLVTTLLYHLSKQVFSHSNSFITQCSMLNSLYDNGTWCYLIYFECPNYAKLICVGELIRTETLAKLFLAIYGKLWHLYKLKKTSVGSIRKIIPWLKADHASTDCRRSL